MGWPLPSEHEIAQACRNRPLKLVQPEHGLYVYTYDILARRRVTIGVRLTDRVPDLVRGKVLVSVTERGERLDWEMTGDSSAGRWRYGDWSVEGGGIQVRKYDRRQGGYTFQRGLRRVRILECGCEPPGES